MSWKQTITTTTIVIFAFPALVYGHGTGVSFEEVVGDYLVDIGYSSQIVTAGESVRFDFSILDKDTRAPESFNSIWVRIEQGRKLFFAGSIGDSGFGTPGFTYNFPEKGSYTVSARFQREEETLGETSFALDVEKSSRQSGGPSSVWLLLSAGFLGMFVGAGGFALVARRGRV